MITFTGNLQNLHEISWFARVFFVFGVFGWSCVVLFEGASSYKEMPQFHGLSEQEKIGQHFP